MFPRGSEKRFCFMKTMNRREFLKAGVSLAAVASGVEMIGGCATTETRRAIPLYNKIQPPQEGCLVGFFKEPEAYARLKDSKFIPKQSAMTGGYQIGNEITYVEKALSVKPFIFVVMGPKLYTDFPVTQSTEVAKRRIVPFVRASLSSIDSPIQTFPEFGPQEIAQGQHDGYIKGFARGAAAFGKKYGGFFITTMEEMNGNWYSWGMNSNCIPAWRHIWQIFEDQGGNQYATWVWMVYCPEGVPAHWANDPELYYPGDKYVDWIGLNAYSIAGNSKADYRLNVLIQETYRRLFKNHGQKPFMLSSFGRTNEEHQSKWLINAYKNIKNSFPAIKAVICFDNTMRLTGDHTLNLKSWQTLKEIFQDPYWVMGK